jgi:hypothetical protein
MRRAAAGLALTALALAAAGSGAHHSFPTYYFEAQTVRISGELVEFDFRAPHAWVKIKGRDDAGVEQTFAAEWSNPNRLARDGVTRDTLKIGDQLVIAGSPGRIAEEHRLHLKAIQRPADGWEWPEQRHRRR